MVYATENKLIREYDGEKLQIEAFGENSLRVRVTRLNSFLENDWALLPQEEQDVQITITRNKIEENVPKVNSEERMAGNGAAIVNGKIKAAITKEGKLIFENDRGKILLKELECDRHSSLGIHSRGLKSLAGGNFKASLKFESDPDEKLFGMGQYQNGIFNLKGSFLELAQRNSQVSIPFVYSSRGYGFF